MRNRSAIMRISPIAANIKVKGKDCWYVGSGGSMGRYTSGAAKKDIKDRLVKEINHGIGIQPLGM